MSYHRHDLAGFSDDAKKAITENPDYFVWWYTTKSIGLCVAVAYVAYLLGQRRGKRSKLGGRVEGT